jgi:formate dehydrogenase alpha subunit
MNVVKALRKAFGTDRIRMMNNSEQVTKADAIFIIGSDITETHPVFNLRVKEALRKYKAKVIVADPIQTHMAKLATHHLAIKPGSETRLIQALVKIILDRGLCDETVLQKYPNAVEALKQATAGITIENVAEETGISTEHLAEAAEVLARAERGVILFEDGITKRKDGYQNVLNLVDLALVAGFFEKDGSGLNALCEENNELGLVDMGGASEFLPGALDYQNAEARAKFSKDWREELPNLPSADLAQILDRARKGEIKALYIVGENPVGTLPASMGVAEALSKVDLVIVQDPFLTEWPMSSSRRRPMPRRREASPAWRARSIRSGWRSSRSARANRTGRSSRNWPGGWAFRWNTEARKRSIARSQRRFRAISRPSRNRCRSGCPVT